MSIARRPPPELFKFAANAWTQPFWDATARHELVAARCAACGTFRLPPTPFCPCCQAQRIDWTVLSGRGEVYSYTIVERAILPAMEGHLPYVPAVITLEGAGGTRLVSNVVDVALDALRVGMPVQVVWDDLPALGVARPRFAPVTGP